jgi:hypothetical protein
MDSISSRRAVGLRMTWIISLETCVVLSLFAGLRQGNNSLGLTFEPTYAIVALTAVITTAQILSGTPLTRGGARMTYLGLLGALLLAMTATSSSSEIYARQKLLQLMLVVLPTFVVGSLVISSSALRVAKLVFAFFVAGLVAGALTSVEAVRSQDGGPLTAFGASYLALSRIAGSGVVVALAYVLLQPPGSVRRLWALAALWVLSVAMVVSGARGPFVAAVAVAVIPLAARLPDRGGSRLRRPVRRYLAVGLVALVCAFAVAMTGAAATLSRIGVLFDSQGDSALNASGRARVTFYEQSLTLWQARPFGYGIGAWPVVAGYGDVRLYPHNMILELGVEGGVIAVAFVVVLGAVAFRSLGRWRSLRSDSLRLTILMLLGYAFLSAMASGDLIDNRIFFMLLGVVGGFDSRLRLPTRQSVLVPVVAPS